MRKTRLLVCTLMGLLLCLAVHAQEPVVSFPQKQMTLAEALDVVEQQSGLSIAYNENLLDLGKVVSTPSGNPLSEVLRLLLEDTGDCPPLLA